VEKKMDREAFGTNSSEIRGNLGRFPARCVEALHGKFGKKILEKKVKYLVSFLSKNVFTAEFGPSNPPR